MTARADLAAITEAAERAIDRPHDVAARRLGAAARRACPTGPMTWDARRLILREVDLILGLMYGFRRGDPSLMEQIIAQHADVAYGTPTLREAARVAPILRRHPELARIGRTEAA